MTTIAGAHVLITGGSSGIGLASARQLAAKGARVSLVARGSDRLAVAEAELQALGATVAVAAADVADQAAVEGAVAALAGQLGPVDILVACAGLTYPGHFTTLDGQHFRRLMEVNYFGMLYAISAVTPAMVERRRGHIIGVSSTAGLIGVFGYSAYCPTKFAVRGLLETLRCELAPHGVQVGCAFPPDTDTPQLAFEEPLKPAETKAISGSIKPIAATKVAEAIVGGIERDRFWIMADAQTRLLARLGGLGRGVLAWDFDRRVRKVQAGS
jgi:3-dehydrosphinganine reductase